MSKKLQKHPGGRPTKFTPDTIYPKVTEYLETCGKNNMSLPTVEGLAIALDVTSETIRQWTKKYKEFSLTIKKLADKFAQGHLQITLEGGYEVDKQAKAVYNCLQVLQNNNNMLIEEKERKSDDPIRKHVSTKILPNLKKNLKPFWNSL